jgi:hypothetical protein
MSRFNPLLIGAVAAAVVALAAYWFLALAPAREKAATLETQVVAKQGELEAAQSLLAGYEKARGGYRRNYGTLVRLGKAVPADDDVRSLVVQLDAAAERSGVDFRSIELEKGGSGPAASATTTAAASTSTAPPGAVPVGSAGFSALPFKFTFRGSFHNLSGFFARLERFVTAGDRRVDVTGRLLRLESLSLAPDAKGFPHIKAEIGASSYLVPPTQGVLGGATPQGPAPAGGAVAAATTPPTTSETTAAADGGTQ